MNSITPHLKQCKKCTQEFPATTDFFNRAKNSKDGLFSWCKTCQRSYMKNRRKDPDVLKREKAYGKAYNSRPEVKERLRIYDSQPERREKRYAAKKAYLATPEGKAKDAAHQKEYHSRPEIKARYQANRKIYKSRPEIQERHKTYGSVYRKRPDIQKREQERRKTFRSRPDIQQREQAQRKEYYARPEVKERYRVHSLNRRGVERSAGTHTLADIKAQYNRQKGKCYYCHKKVTEYHVDHVIPLSRGGSNGPENLVITCPTCNLSKHDRLWRLL